MKVRRVMAASLVSRFLTMVGLSSAGLAAEVDKVDDLPKHVRGFYTEKDGKWVLDPTKVEIEDVSALRLSLTESRNDTKKLKDQLKELKDSFGDLDPAAVREMLKSFGDDQDKRDLAAGKVEEVVARRMDKAKKEFDRQIAELQGQAEKANGRAKKYEQAVLDNYIRDAAGKVGVHEHAIEDALFRGRAMFKLDDDGNPIQPDDDGKPTLGKDAKTPFSPMEWLATVKENKTAPHWFMDGNSGGGAENRTRQNGSGGNTKLSGMAPGSAKLHEARRQQSKSRH